MLHQRNNHNYMFRISINKTHNYANKKWPKVGTGGSTAGVAGSNPAEGTDNLSCVCCGLCDELITSYRSYTVCVCVCVCACVCVRARACECVI